MISRNTSLKRKPFLLKPQEKDYIWGGQRLLHEFNKEPQFPIVAETWECSTHPDGPSMVVSGDHTGKNLTEVLAEHPEYLGTNVQGCAQFPILIKFIDAKKDLSVQVHPDDAYAYRFENGQLGKSEMWYVVDAEKDSMLVHGFQHDVTKEHIRDSIEKGTIEKYLQKVKVEKDDVFFMDAGVVHAIGAGNLIIEIQENSNLTYRLYDYQRTDANGNRRELHIDKALDVMKLEANTKPRQPVRVLQYSPGLGREFLCRCKYFQVKRYLLNTEETRNMAEVNIGEHSFKVLVCMSGCGVLFTADGEGLRFFKGDTIFIPATSDVVKLHGKAKLLGVNC